MKSWIIWIYLESTLRSKISIFSKKKKKIMVLWRVIHSSQITNGFKSWYSTLQILLLLSPAGISFQATVNVELIWITVRKELRAESRTAVSQWSLESIILHAITTVLPREKYQVCCCILRLEDCWTSVAARRLLWGKAWSCVSWDGRFCCGQSWPCQG